ncbi:DUF2243 domain-containing protein [Neorhizobium sp. SOG26]|uniref:DUF2243 domain-containing protein n=1 Tax=Neorhizobium sp. SOG26 TaxID=2060726 RepID=UPI001FDF5DCE|nr:DUF2243 domain-containing protein [Neorhizobium sp. SOG26]
MRNAVEGGAYAGDEKSTACAGYMLGFAFGGFFDGILLHQILQWHHLLSGLEQVGQDIRALILTDGLFHLLMYVVAIVGLWLLWRSRSNSHATTVGGGALLSSVLIGFGGWHVVDAVLSHWILGIHRIRMDTENPLLWDLLWFAIFGVVPLVAGLARRASKPTPGRLLVSPTALAFSVVIAGLISAFPPQQEGPVTVLFAPGVSPVRAMTAIGSVNGQVIWTDTSSQVWTIVLPEGQSSKALYRHGALLVSGSLLPAGCLDWVRL